MTEVHDLIVVGGGIIGTCTAYLASLYRPQWRILLVEQSEIGCGATGFSAGVDVPFADTEAKRSLVARASTIHDELMRRIPELPIRPIPLFGIASRTSVDSLRASFPPSRLRLADNPETDATKQWFPGLALKEDEVLLRAGMGFVGDAAGICRALMRHFESGGHGSYREGTPVTQTRFHAGVHRVQTPAETLLGRHLIVATGPWSTRGPGSDLARGRGVRLKKVAALCLADTVPADAPVLCFFDHGAFLLPQRDQWLFSFTSRAWDVQPDVDRLGLDRDEERLAGALLDVVLPGWSGKVHRRQIFCDAYAVDGTPFVEVSPSNGMVWAGAGSGSGYRLAPALAYRALAALPSFFEAKPASAGQPEPTSG